MDGDVGSPEYRDHQSRMIRGGRNDAPAYVFDRFFSGDLDDLAPEEAAWLVANAWSAAEYPARYVEPECWVEIFEGVGWLHEQGYPTQRPDGPLTAFRGEPAEDDGPRMSWSLRVEQARWFADRWATTRGRPAVVRRALIQPDVMAGILHGGRDEAEVVVMPWTVEGSVVEVIEPAPSGAP